ncbi:hypothetical protein NL676_002463 [Syzygium grande]|nr:hypothetical protein NL676_002463 [Syzygium grande]
MPTPKTWDNLRETTNGMRHDQRNARRPEISSSSNSARRRRKKVADNMNGRWRDYLEAKRSSPWRRHR